MTEQREVTVPSALQAHQLRQWMTANGIDVVGSRLGDRGTETILTIVASPEQWAGIHQWLEKARG